MTRRLAPAVLLVALALAGCVYYPTIPDIGGIRIRAENGRAVLRAPGLVVFADVVSTGKFGDALVGATTDVARRAVVLVPPGQPAGRIEVPGVTTVRLTPDGPHIVLSELTRDVRPGDVVLVTLEFEKVGRIGVPTRVE